MKRKRKVREIPAWVVPRSGAATACTAVGQQAGPGAGACAGQVRGCSPIPSDS